MCLRPFQSHNLVYESLGTGKFSMKPSALPPDVFSTPLPPLTDTQDRQVYGHLSRLLPRASLSSPVTAGAALAPHRLEQAWHTLRGQCPRKDSVRRDKCTP